MESHQGMEMHQRSKNASSESQEIDYGNEASKEPSNRDYAPKQTLDVREP